MAVRDGEVKNKNVSKTRTGKVAVKLKEGLADCKGGSTRGTCRL